MAIRGYVVWPNLTNSGYGFIGGNMFIIGANSLEEAQALAASYFKGDANKFIQYDNPPGEYNVSVMPIDGMFDFTGWKMRLVVYDADPVIDISYVGVLDDYIEDVVAGFVAAINTAAVGLTASYDAPSHVITIAAGGDSMGDKRFDILFTPGMDPELTEFEPQWDYKDPQPIPYGTYLDNKVDQGLAGDALTIELVGFDILEPGWLNVVGNYVAGQGDF